MQKILDREAFIEQATQAGFTFDEKIMKLYETVLPMLLLSYEQGKKGKEFDVLPTTEVQS